MTSRRTLAEYPEDIQKRIVDDFGADAAIARQLLEADIAERLVADRIVRCVLFTANGDLEKLRSALALARLDYRDLIMGAEYDEVMMRRRDFNQPFPATSGFHPEP